MSPAKPAAKPVSAGKPAWPVKPGAVPAKPVVTKPASAKPTFATGVKAPAPVKVALPVAAVPAKPSTAFSSRAIGNAPAVTGLGAAVPGKVSVRFASGPGSDPIRPLPIFAATPMPPTAKPNDLLTTPYSVLSPVAKSKSFTVRPSH
jgi:hypothetical protein